MKVLGKLVLINKPVRKEDVVQLSEEVKRQLDDEFLKQFKELEVYAVGDEVTKVKAGDRVYVKSHALMGSEIVELEDGLKFMVYESEIAIVH